MVRHIKKNIKYFLIAMLFVCYVVLMCIVYLQTALNHIPSYDPEILVWKSLLIDTPGYQLPDFDPFDKSISSILQPAPQNFDCSEGRRALTSGLSNYRKHPQEKMKCVLVYHKDHLQDYNVASVHCCYQSISRNNSDPLFPDTIYNFDAKCHSIEEDITIILDKAIMVTCSSDGIAVYKNVHFFVQQKMDPERKDKKSSLERPLSVLIFGLDAISRLNMERYMPKTLKALKDNGAIDLRGFNKVAENTFPNIISLLTGNFQDHWQKSRAEEMGHPFFDGYPFIWKNFSQVGHTTIFAEDCLSLGLFHYLKVKKGFRVPPTDYYLHPYFRAAEETLGYNGNLAWLAGCQNICIGPNSSLKIILKYASDISQVFKNIPYFSFMWSASISHDRLHFAGLADDPTSEFISEMADGNFWNNTIVLFMSDHGILYGPIRKTYLGRVEANLPLGFMILPKWFKEYYPTAYGNLVGNQNRLVTPFDLRETLLDVAQERYKDEDYINSFYDSSNLPSKISLFKKVPGTRTCLEALIPIQFCSGIHASDVSDNPKIILAVKYLLEIVNNGLDAHQECHKYTEFILQKVYKIGMIRDFNQTLDDRGHLYYEFQWKTLPGSALMEALLKVTKISNTSSDYKYSLQGTISRLNSYEGQSNCVNEKDPELKKVCLCKSLVPVK